MIKGVSCVNTDNRKINSKDEDINSRMEGFDKVLKSEEVKASHSKFGSLPYGFKRYITCPRCSKIIEIESIDEKQAVYNCVSCRKAIRVNIK